MSVLLSVAAVAVIICTLAGAMVRLLASRFPKRWSSAVWTAWIVSPVVLALASAVALLSPHPFAVCHCAAHALHHPHLCLTHPDLAAELVFPSLAIVSLWLVVVVPRLWGLARAVASSARRVRELRAAPADPDMPARLLDCGSRTAFTAGAIRPVIVFDRALWDALDDDARCAVLEHEVGHVERGDGLTLVALRACLALSPFLPTALVHRWQRAAELACDRRAARRLDPETVAQALLAVHQLGCPIAEEAIAFGVIAHGGLEDRVHALLAEDDGARVEGSDLFAVSLPIVATCVLALVWPGDSLHHAVETLLGFLGH